MASAKSPLMTAATPGGHAPSPGPSFGSGPGPGSAPRPTATGPASQPISSDYFNQQYLQATPNQQQSTSHAYAAPSHMPARSPYTDSQNFMPSNQKALSVDDDKTFLNTIANSQAQAQAQNEAYLPSSTPATGGRNTPLGGSLPYQYSNIDAASETGANNLATNAMANSYNHSVLAAGPSSTPRTGAGAGAGAGATAYGIAAGNSGRFAENWDASQRGSSLMDGDSGAYSDGGASVQLPARSNTLKKKSSLRRASSLHRSSSRRSMKAGSVRSLALQSRSDQDESQSAFYCPVPTRGNPTEAIMNRLHAWRKILKDLIAYHREIQTHYEQRAKSLQRLAGTLNGSTLPPGFMTTGGLDDATQMLRNFHKQSMSEATKAREVEEEVIGVLAILRNDLNQKIREVKNITGDFRNNVDKEMDATKKAVKSLQDNLGQAELDSSLTTGRQDPYLLRLAADHQLERQIREENYLHQAFLNLEKSGHELESIIVGEIQKSYSAYVGILRREADTTWSTVEELRGGPIAMPKDQEWQAFVRNSDQVIGPDVPIRSFQFISYPGQNHFACQEIRAGLLERKSKYLKSYTAGWYVLSPTHLHEFRSADKMQAPVMSLYLPEQKLGSHSAASAASSKFVLKGRQTGGLHRGHTWVFRAESHDTMMAWFDDLYALTEKTPQEREAFARGHQHSRSVSRASQHTYSSDGVVNEEDDEPFAANSPAALAGAAAGATAADAALAGGQQPTVAGDAGTGGVIGARTAGPRALSPDGQPSQYRSQSATPSRRPSQGGRFPSDLQVNAQRGRELQAAGIPVSPTSAGGSGSHPGSGQGSEYGITAATGVQPDTYQQAQVPNSYIYAEQPSQQQFQQPQQQQYPEQPVQYQETYPSYTINQVASGAAPHSYRQEKQQKPQQQPPQQQQPGPTAQVNPKQYPTTQAALAAQAQQAPTTVAPVIPMFVNVNEKSSPSAADSGKVFDTDVGADGGAPLTNGYPATNDANGVSGYTNANNYANSVGGDQQQQQQQRQLQQPPMYAHEQTLMYAATETQPPTEPQTMPGGPRSRQPSEQMEAPFITTPVLGKTNRIINGGAGGGASGAVGSGDGNNNGILNNTKSAVERPGLSSREKSEAVTLSNLHIPGQYPGPATDSK